MEILLSIFLFLAATSLYFASMLSKNTQSCKYLDNSNDGVSSVPNVPGVYAIDQEEGCTILYCSDTVIITDDYSSNCTHVNVVTNYELVNIKEQSQTYENFCGRIWDEVEQNGKNNEQKCLVTKFKSLKIKGGLNYFDNIYKFLSWKLFSNLELSAKLRAYYEVKENYIDVIISYIVNDAYIFPNCILCQIEEIMYSDELSLTLFKNESDEVQLLTSPYSSIKCVHDFGYRLSYLINKDNVDELNSYLLKEKINFMQPEFFFEMKLLDRDASKITNVYTHLLQMALSQSEDYENESLTSIIFSLERIIYLGAKEKLTTLHSGSMLLRYLVFDNGNNTNHANITCKTDHLIDIASDGNTCMVMACLSDDNSLRNDLIMIESPYDSLKIFSVTWQVTKFPSNLEKYVCNFLLSDTKEWSHTHCKITSIKVNDILKVTCKCPLSGYVTIQLQKTHLKIIRITATTVNSIICILLAAIIIYNFKTAVYRSKYQNRNAQIKLGILFLYFLTRIIKLQIHDNINFCYAISTFKFVLFLTYNTQNALNAVFFFKFKIFIGIRNDFIPILLIMFFPVTMTVILILSTKEFFIPVTPNCIGNNLTYHVTFLALSTCTFILYLLSFITARYPKIRRITAIIQTLFIIIKESLGMVFTLYISLEWFKFIEIIFAALFGVIVASTEFYASKDESNYLIDNDDFKNLRG